MNLIQPLGAEAENKEMRHHTCRCCLSFYFTLPEMVLGLCMCECSTAFSDSFSSLTLLNKYLTFDLLKNALKMVPSVCLLRVTVGAFSPRLTLSLELLEKKAEQV